MRAWQSLGLVIEQLTQALVRARELRLGKTGGATRQSCDFSVCVAVYVVQPHDRASQRRQRRKCELDIVPRLHLSLRPRRAIDQQVGDRLVLVGVEISEAAMPR